MFHSFYPAEMAESSYTIDYEGLYEQGYRGLIYDIDNTLVEHGADANSEVVALFRRLNKIGFRICLLSNNQEPRVRRFYRGVNIPGVHLHYIFNAHKPSRKSYRKAMRIMHTTKKNTLFIGDQIFTDIYGANRTGIRSLLVKPINKNEEIQIVMKRRLERIILHFYKKEKLERLKHGNVVLIGFDASGRREIGKRLAELTGLGFTDTDELLTKRLGADPVTVMRQHGEDYFRDAEYELLCELERKAKRSVISVGSGMPVAVINQKRLRGLGEVIYLKTAPEQVLSELRKDVSRPLFYSSNRDDEIMRLVGERNFAYQVTAHKVVSVSGHSAAENAAEIKRIMS